jgi:hypothetical protein
LYFRLVAVRRRNHGPTAQIRVAQQAAADRKKRVAVARREMAKQDRKTVKMLRARYAAFLLGGNKTEASRTLDAIMSIQAQYGWE